MGTTWIAVTLGLLGLDQSMKRGSRLVADPTWCTQEKKDGRRLLISNAGGTISGINRKGLLVGLPEPLINDAQKLAPDFILDGECVGETFFAFDLQSLWTGSVTEKTYSHRLALLTEFLQTQDLTNIQLIETAFDPEDKATMLLRLRQENREGVQSSPRSMPSAASPWA